MTAKIDQQILLTETLPRTQSCKCKSVNFPTVFGSVFRSSSTVDKQASPLSFRHFACYCPEPDYISSTFYSCSMQALWREQLTSIQLKQAKLFPCSDKGKKHQFPCPCSCGWEWCSHSQVLQNNASLHEIPKMGSLPEAYIAADTSRGLFTFHYDIVISC